MTMDYCESEGGYMVELNTQGEEAVLSQQVIQFSALKEHSLTRDIAFCPTK
jgi:hypothetical protein